MSATSIPLLRYSIRDQVVDRLQQAIADGHYAVGQALPSEREMAQRFDVSRSTLRQSLKDLAGMGLVATRAGMGTDAGVGLICAEIHME